MFRDRSGGRLYCFSPPVMVATFVFEFSLLIYSIWRYKLNPVTRLVAAILFCLGLFQLAEYNVCGGLGASAATWSRVGFVMITMLPVLVIHLITTLAGRRLRLLVSLAYLTALGWVAVFGFSSWAFAGHVCAGNYVIFQLRIALDNWYFAYYYGWLLVGMALCLFLAKQTTKQAVRQMLRLQLLGYLVFLLPTIILNTFKPSTIDGLPSVMCGFAVLYAVLLVFGILPIYHGNAKQSRKLGTDKH